MASNESQAHWRRNLLVHVGRLQTPGARVDGKHNNIIRPLIRNQQKSARRINREIARPVSLSGDMLNQLEFTRPPINLEHDDAVVPTIRAVEKPSRR
jgi:hypothetical protein